ncbi:hypothetical protein ACPPVQ_16750 [Diaminobutyricibacter sp. McL0618]|uniref:hypothetical protein n=1 Tax=Leifsonia sp. McL0618 TaxID=3415677 RepID=UPI003CFA06A1
MSTSAPLDEARADAGLTLIELLIAALLTLLVIAMVGGLFVGASRTQNTVRSATQAADLGQLISRSIEQGVNNATALSVQVDSTSGSQLLLAREFSMDPNVDPTQGASSGTSCRAWLYTTALGGAIYTKITTPAVPIVMPIGTPDSSWTLIGNGLQVQVDASPSALIFAAPNGTRVDLKFDVTTGTGQPVHIETTATIPNPTTESAPCF